MDIAITLQKCLWEKIVSGEKTIELRKGFPKEFDVNTDRVYVCLKGTDYVVGFFTVLCFETISADYLTSCEKIVTKISVPILWINNYIKNSSWVYLWRIRGIVIFKGIGHNRSLYSIDKNPQSFIYLH